MFQNPVAIGLFLCAVVIVDERTKNITPVNCFSKRVVETVPSDLTSFVLFALLTDGSGTGVLEVEIRSLESEAYDLVYNARLPIRFTDPLQTVRCVIRPRGCMFPEAGLYDVVLLADGEPIARGKLQVEVGGDGS